ncbi:MAG: hypothetical protein JJT96_12165 [Opitutales bacterium]|nr:hypothetical protein [Opitutales bacterium]
MNLQIEGFFEFGVQVFAHVWAENEKAGQGKQGKSFEGLVENSPVGLRVPFCGWGGRVLGWASTGINGGFARTYLEQRQRVADLIR